MTQLFCYLIRSQYHAVYQSIRTSSKPKELLYSQVHLRQITKAHLIGHEKEMCFKKFRVISTDEKYKQEPLYKGKGVYKFC